MKKFDLERLKGRKVVVNCVTEKEAKAFNKWVNSLGVDEAFNDYWGDYEEKTCVELDDDLMWWYDRKEYYERLGYEIISFEEALFKKEKKLSKKDIKINKLKKENKELKEKLTNANQAVRVLINTKEKLSNNEHYKRQGIDTIARCKANMILQSQKDICIFNIDRYLHREKGQNLSDIKKIRDYLNWLEEIENQLQKVTTKENITKSM